MKTGSVYEIEDGILYECISFEEEGRYYCSNRNRTSQ